MTVRPKGVPNSLAAVPSHRAGSLTCLLALAVAAAGPSTRPTSRPSGGGGTGVVPLDTLFDLLDKDHDGRISKDGATGVYARRFSLWDAGHHGFVTRAEVHDYRIAHGIADDGSRLPPGGRPGVTPPVILLQPTSWRFERFAVPLSFAPTVALTGTEEARFSPGMYDTSPNHYFTYAVAITAEGDVDWGPADQKTFLETYFRGLSASRSKRTGVAVPNLAETQAIVTPAQGVDAAGRFNAKVTFFDSFADGRRVLLNIETQIVRRPAVKQTYMVLLVSPRASDSATWRELRDFGRQAANNIPAQVAGPAARPLGRAIQG